jgi:hypothetical protein
MSIEKDLKIILNKYQTKYSTSIFRNKENYAQWLAQTYFFVRHSTALLGFAMPHLKNDDLRHHFEQHLAEEKRHDLILLKDLERLGYKIEDFKEHCLTKAFYQGQYFRISFNSGTSLLGYILLLEGLAVSWGQAVFEDIKDVHKGSSLFLKVHAEEDPHHLDGAIKTILSLSKAEQDMIHENLLCSDELYESMIQKIFFNESAIKKAA